MEILLSQRQPLQRLSALRHWSKPTNYLQNLAIEGFECLLYIAYWRVLDFWTHTLKISWLKIIAQLRLKEKISDKPVKLSSNLAPGDALSYFLNAIFDITIAQPLMSTKRFEDEESVLDFGFVPLESEKNCTRRTWRGAIRSSLKSASIHTAFAAQQNGECMQPSPGTAAAFSRGTSYGLNGLAGRVEPTSWTWGW